MMACYRLKYSVWVLLKEASFGLIIPQCPRRLFNKKTAVTTRAISGCILMSPTRSAASHSDLPVRDFLSVRPPYIATDFRSHAFPRIKPDLQASQQKSM